MDPLIFCIILSISLVLSIIPELTQWKRLKKYWIRTCKGHEWRKQFPGSSKEDIRSFLEIFIESFCFRSSKRLKFSPNDKFMDVYRTRYPSNRIEDLDELETFQMELERNYGKDVADTITPEMTLGDIFDITRR